MQINFNVQNNAARSNLIARLTNPTANIDNSPFGSLLTAVESVPDNVHSAINRSPPGGGIIRSALNCDSEIRNAEGSNPLLNIPRDVLRVFLEQGKITSELNLEAVNRHLNNTNASHNRSAASSRTVPAAFFRTIRNNPPILHRLVATSASDPVLAARAEALNTLSFYQAWQREYNVLQSQSRNEPNELWQQVNTGR